MNKMSISKPKQQPVTKCLLPFCEWNKSNKPDLNSLNTFLEKKSRTYQDITGEVKLFYGCLLKGNNTTRIKDTNIKIMICQPHFELYETLKIAEKDLNDTRMNGELLRIYKNLNDILEKNCELRPLYNIYCANTVDVFSRLVDIKLNIDQLSDDEMEILIQIQKFLKYTTRSNECRIMLAKLNLVTSLVELISKIKFNEDKRTSIFNGILINTFGILMNFAIDEDSKQDKEYQKVLGLCRVYLDMNNEELQFQCLSIIWALSYNTMFKYEIKNSFEFYLKLFMHFESGWSIKMHEIFVCFFGMVYCVDNDKDYSYNNENNRDNIRPFISRISKNKVIYNEKTNYFVDRIIGYFSQ